MTESQHQVAHGSYIAQAIGAGAQAMVQIGLSSEEVASLLVEAGTAHLAKVDDLARQLNASREAVTGFLKILREDDVPLDSLASKLELIAQRHLALVSRLGALDPENDCARHSIASARDIIARAASSTEYGQADHLLFEAEQSQQAQIQLAEKLARDAEAAAVIRRHSDGLGRTRHQRRARF